MRAGLTLLLSALVATAAAAQADEPLVPSPTPVATLTGGVGNAMGWFGLQAEGYFAEGRASIFGGLGYVPEFDRNWSGPAVAGGARLYTAGRKHRFFLEASVSLLAIEEPAVGSPAQGDDAFYGPGLQVGYQLLKPSGLTFMVSGGVGFVLDAPPQVQTTGFTLGIGLGKTWSRP